MITIVGPREAPGRSEFPFFVNTTSRSPNAFGKEFSPFFLGPCKLWDGAPAEEAITLENAWQYSKVYPGYTNDDDLPNEKWVEWARRGLLSKVAHRYPKGKGARPLFAYWENERLGYIEARKRIYIPLYKEAVRKKDAFKELCELYKEHGKLILWDFDGYNRKRLNMTNDDVVNCPTKTMGHAFVIEQLLIENFQKELDYESKDS